jgi:hypothetical protein
MPAASLKEAKKAGQLRHTSRRWSPRFLPIPFSVSSCDLDDVCLGEGDVRQSAYSINVTGVADENLIIGAPVAERNAYNDVAHPRFGQSPDVVPPLAGELK